MLDKSKVKKILVITLSNIGDVVLTTPVIDALRKNFQSAGIDVMVGPRAFELFRDDPRINRVIIYDKRKPLPERAKLIFTLRESAYDLVVDLRNTLIPLFLAPRYRTSVMRNVPGKVAHKKDVHLSRLKGIGIDTSYADFDIWTGSEQEEYADKLLGETEKGIVAIAPGARSDTKRWSEENFALLSGRIAGMGMKIALVGDSSDEKISVAITAKTGGNALNLCGKTTLTQLASVLKRCALAISNDSAVMHIATAVKTPVVAIFGPTDPAKYAPTGERDAVVRKEIPCSPCERAQCSRSRECMELITVDEVYDAAMKILKGVNDGRGMMDERRNRSSPAVNCDV